MSSRTQSPKADERGILRSERIGLDARRITTPECTSAQRTSPNPAVPFTACTQRSPSPITVHGLCLAAHGSCSRSGTISYLLIGQSRQRLCAHSCHLLFRWIHSTGNAGSQSHLFT